MHRQDGRQEIDRRTLLAKGAAFAALLVTGCARKTESWGFATPGFGLQAKTTKNQGSPGV